MNYHVGRELFGLSEMEQFDSVGMALASPEMIRADVARITADTKQALASYYALEKTAYQDLLEARLEADQVVLLSCGVEDLLESQEGRVEFPLLPLGGDLEEHGPGIVLGDIEVPPLAGEVDPPDQTCARAGGE